jgi:hypothetical protein
MQITDRTRSGRRPSTIWPPTTACTTRASRRTSTGGDDAGVVGEHEVGRRTGRERPGIAVAGPADQEAAARVDAPRPRGARGELPRLGAAADQGDAVAADHDRVGPTGGAVCRSIRAR